MGSFGSLRGHHSLKTASEVKHDLNLNSGTQITYFSMSTLLTCVAIAAGNNYMVTSINLNKHTD